jgi:hypothetical protein
MGTNKPKLLNLKEIEGKISPHQEQVSRALKTRSAALELVDNVDALAEFIGGKVESLGLREDWAISKEIFPGVSIYFVFNRSDDEFPATLRVLFAGERLFLMPGEDLAVFAIHYAGHMLRFIRETNKDRQLPEVCYRV